MHKTLRGWNDPTGKRHEPGEVADYSDVPDLPDLLAQGVVREWFEAIPAPTFPADADEGSNTSEDEPPVGRRGRSKAL